MHLFDEWMPKNAYRILRCVYISANKASEIDRDSHSDCDLAQKIPGQVTVTVVVTGTAK